MLHKVNILNIILCINRITCNNKKMKYKTINKIIMMNNKIKIKKKRLRKRILLFLMINNNRMFKINLKVSFFNPTKTKHNKVNFNKNHNSHNTISNNKTK